MSTFGLQQKVGQPGFAIDEVGEEMFEIAALERGGDAVEAVVDQLGLGRIENAYGAVDVNEDDGADGLLADQHHRDTTRLTASLDQSLDVVAFDDDHGNAETHEPSPPDDETGPPGHPAEPAAWHGCDTDIADRVRRPDPTSSHTSIRRS